MLYEFLISNFEELTSRCRMKVVGRNFPRATKRLEHGIPVFLRQLTEILRAESLDASGEGSSVARETPESYDAIGRTATSHGTELLLEGFTLEQVVYDYGDLCQAITELAIERDAQITNTEFHTLNRCLDNAIADAASAFTRSAPTMNGSLDFFAHELNLINSAMHAVDALKHGYVGVSGSTGDLLEWTLKSLQSLTAGALVDARLRAGIPELRERVLVSAVLEEHQRSAAIDARARGLKFIVADIEPGLAVDVDRQILEVAVTNLLQNAFKFTRAHGSISLKASLSADRVLIEVEDECGGLPPGESADLLRTFEQRSSDRSGLGLGLSICRRGVEANGGQLRVRNLPGSGCVFTIDLPIAGRVEQSDKRVAA